jgi:Cu(I)/Ag(I) efflux system membrane protein CusA/SilA
MSSTGAGADVMMRIAAPKIGGLFTSFLMELLVYSAVYLLWKWHTEVKDGAQPAPQASVSGRLEATPPF